MKYFLLPLLAFFASCNNADKSESPGKEKTDKESFPIKELVIENAGSNETGGDLKLSIVSSTNNDTSDTYRAISTYRGKQLGLEVTIPKTKPGDEGGFGDGLLLKSIGSESDYLLVTLATLYKQNPSGEVKFAKQLSLSYVDLNAMAKSMSGGKSYQVGAHYKLFLGRDDDYAEIFLNINKEEKSLELKEKDEEYRASLVKLLTDSNTK